MTYARIVNGIVTRIISNVDNKMIFMRLGFKLSFNKRIDNLEVQPQVGWIYSEEEGFSAP